MRNLHRIIFAILATATFSLAQPRTVGVIVNDTSLAWQGYTLLAPKLNSATYLINNEGRIVNRWTRSSYPPGQSVYLLPNGHLLRTCFVQGSLSSGGGEGGRLEEYTWGDTLVWSFDYTSQNYVSHHDIRVLPNGNILLLAIEKKTYAECVAAGFNPARIPDVQSRGYMLPDYVIEVHPTLPTGGTIVWQWHTWDHLIQDFDATKSNYGTPSQHPELIDCDGDGRNLPVFWNHMNSITYSPALDQVLLSVRGNSEIWVVDHSTTTTQASSHTGGTHNRGGDLLYRWGNPTCYGSGTATNRQLFEQHDAEWIPAGSPGAGHITIFNNGLNRNYSSVDEFIPPVDSAGNYTFTAPRFGPTSATWTYTASPPSAMYAADICGAQRLPNGNTLVCYGTKGNLIEVTSTGQTVWFYTNPVINSGPVMQGDSITDDPTHPGERLNMVFRANRYAPTYTGFQGRDLTPGNFIERYPNAVGESSTRIPTTLSLNSCYPNPFNAVTQISFTVPKTMYLNLQIFDMQGRSIATLIDANTSSGSHRIAFDGKLLSTGIYFVRLSGSGIVDTRKLVLLK